MVKIKNIKLINSTIYADCYAEGKEIEYFTIEIDIINKYVVSHSRDEYDAYVSHAKKHLLSFIENDKELPEETGTMWV